MNCRDFEADLVDRARGAEISPTAAERLGEHLEQCAACASRAAIEQRLTESLHALKAAAPALSRQDAMEAHLLRAFAEHQEASQRRAPVPRPLFGNPAARAWLAAAAVLLLAVALWQGTGRWRPAGPAESARTEPAPALNLDKPTAAAPAIDGPRASVSAAPPAIDEPRTRVSDAPPAGDEGVLRFVALPTAIGLPRLESGRIVRVELPTAVLPAYGLDVVPGPAAAMVEADVLVGQDGQARAIRFVTLDSRSRRRP